MNKNILIATRLSRDQIQTLLNFRVTYSILKFILFFRRIFTWCYSKLQYSKYYYFYIITQLELYLIPQLKSLNRFVCVAPSLVLCCHIGASRWHGLRGWPSCTASPTRRTSTRASSPCRTSFTWHAPYWWT